jgi:peptidoglycan hydrolase-like protein with peptidoglycan-binding domain
MSLIASILVSLSIFSPANPAESPADGREKAVSKRVVQSGQCGQDVKNINQKLLELGLMGRRENSSKCFDSMSLQATIAFQKYTGLVADGAVGPKTRRALDNTNRLRLEKITEKKRSGNYVVISLKKQLLLLIKDNQVTKAFNISSGKPGYSTPSGSFRVYRKEEMSWSNPYSTWMPWASYFYGGIAVHQSDSVPAYPASHGCVRISELFSKYVYERMPFNKRVIVI